MHISVFQGEEGTYLFRIPNNPENISVLGENLEFVCKFVGFLSVFLAVWKSYEDGLSIFE